ncbi:hypothetical protein ACFE04_014033 [Oxalis oulophora]
MGLGTPKSAAILMLILNLGLYFIVTMIATWAVNYGINKSHLLDLSPPAQIFPIYYPIGNMATGFVVIFSLIAGVVGMTTSITGLLNVLEWNASNLHAASFSSVTTWSITLLAMGLACKEIDLGYKDANLRTLEVMTVIVSVTQMFCIGAIYTGLKEIAAHQRMLESRRYLVGIFLFVVLYKTISAVYYYAVILLMKAYWIPIANCPAFTSATKRFLYSIIP